MQQNVELVRHIKPSVIVSPVEKQRNSLKQPLLLILLQKQSSPRRHGLDPPDGAILCVKDVLIGGLCTEEFARKCAGFEEKIFDERMVLDSRDEDVLGFKRYL